jgi:hypothetical protein
VQAGRGKTRVTLLRGYRTWILALAGAALLAAGAPARAAESGRPAADEQERQVRELEKRIEDLEREVQRLKGAAGETGAAAAAVEELERRIEALGRDLERLRVGEAAEVRADASAHGFGPAASKIYKVKRGLSVGGYGEMLYQNFDNERDDGAPAGKSDKADFQRAVLYFGYKFNDRILFNSETEFEHATTGEGDEEKGEVSVEFAYLDFLIHKTFNVRTGLLLVPVGLINELHEPPVFHGARRPEVETQVIPSTWRENGAGIFGDLGPFSYRMYAMASLDGTRLQAANIRESRQGGSESNAEDLAIAARLDLTGVPGLIAGASVFTGNTGLDNFSGGRLTLVDAHADWKWKGLELRGLLARAIVSDAEAIDAAHLDEDGIPAPLTGDDTVGERLFGWYGQIAYDVLSPLEGTEQQLFPFVRYERLDTQHRVPEGFSADPANDRTIVTGGLTYKPIANVAIKVDFQNFRNDARTGINQVNLAVSYLF